MREGGSWSGRRIVITAIFGLTLIYGFHDLLGGKSDSRIAPGAPLKSEELGVAVPASPNLGEVADGEEVSGPRPEPSPAVLAEAKRWRKKSWDGADPFVGPRWSEGPVLEKGAPVYDGTDTLLRATSRSPSGWQAVVGERVLRVGDSFLGGQVVSISRGKVVVRGAGWEETLRFPEERGY